MRRVVQTWLLSTELENSESSQDKNLVTDNEEKIVNGKKKDKIATIYVQKLLKGWTKELEQAKYPKTLDSQWGKLANGS